MPDILMMLLWYFVFLISLTIHEASHAWAAMKLGDTTAYDGGQVTFDPVPHIQREPIGTVVIPFLTYILNGWMMGWASAPVDSRWVMHHPKKASLVSLAGPMANFCAVIVTGVFIRIGLLFNFFHPPDYMSFTTVVTSRQAGIVYPLSVLLSIMFSLNVLLFVFNLLPIPPLDGSGILPLFFNSQEAAVRYLHFIHNPTLYIIGILIAWRVFSFIFPPIHGFFVNGLYFGLTYY